MVNSPNFSGCFHKYFLYFSSIFSKSHKNIFKGDRGKCERGRTLLQKVYVPFRTLPAPHQPYDPEGHISEDQHQEYRGEPSSQRPAEGDIYDHIRKVRGYDQLE